MTKPGALVLCGDGINCELETEFALHSAGFDTTLIHTSQLLKEPKTLKRYQLLVLPGGFSFGDEIASGKVLAIKLKDHLQALLHEFIDRGSLLLASCNGFQVVVQMGLLPFSTNGEPSKASLIHNSSLKFTNRWVSLDINDASPCLFLTGLEKIELPIRHGEGRLVVEPKGEQFVKAQACLRYRHDVNGSFDRIAGLTNPKGNVLGLMPHPEAFVRWTQHPAWTLKKEQASGGQEGQCWAAEAHGDPNRLPDGLAIFNNAAKAISER